METGPQAPHKWSGLIARLGAEVDARERLLAHRHAQAIELAAILITGFGARRVLLFGSVARGESDGKLDIDLAVEGLDRDLELRALAALSDHAGCAVDLVRVEDASPRLAAAIERDGVVLDERR